MEIKCRNTTHRKNAICEIISIKIEIQWQQQQQCKKEQAKSQSQIKSRKYRNNKLSNVSNYVSNESFSKWKCNLMYNCVLVYGAGAGKGKVEAIPTTVVTVSVQQ